MIDNKDLIVPLLSFDTPEDFYFVQIIRRKKDLPGEVKGRNNNARIVKTYYVRSVEYLEDRYEEIKMLCKVFNARAGINLNKRNLRTVALETLAETARRIANHDYTHIYRQYDSTCGKLTGSDKRWIIDVDFTNGEFPSDYIEMLQYINAQLPVGDKVIAKLPSKNGLHLITTPFNTKDFSNLFPQYSLHRNNPTNLFIP